MISQLNARQRKAWYCTWRTKVLSVSFLPFKAGSEILPARSGAANLDALKDFSVERRARKSQEHICVRSAAKLILLFFGFQSWK
jgi:hypothetical protein